jgi:hypothetical protein
MGWYGPQNTGVVAGGTGTSKSDSNHKLVGNVLAVAVKYHNNPDAGSIKLTVQTKGVTCPSYSLLVLNHNATDGNWMPYDLVNNTSGALMTFNGAQSIPDQNNIDDYLTVLLEGAADGDNADVWIYLDR